MVKCFNPDVVAVGQLLKQLFPVCAFCFNLFFARSHRSFSNKNDQSAQLLFNVFYFIRFIHQTVKVAGVKDKQKMDEKSILSKPPCPFQGMCLRPNTVFFPFYQRLAVVAGRCLDWFL